MNSINDPEFSRNFGFWNEAEQQAIRDSCGAIAGVGGDGYQLGMTLVENGIGALNIGDPEVFERENINRVPGARVDTIGRKKVDVFREEALKKNPDIIIRTFDEGVTPDNIQEFMEGATIAFDETELTMLNLGTMVAREARRRGIPDVLVMNIGFAASVTSFHPEGPTFEEMMGIPNDMPLEEVAKQELDLARCVPYIPPYVDLATFKEVAAGGAPLPSIAQGVNQAAAIGSSQAFLHMVSGVSKHRPQPVWAPNVAYADSLTFDSGIIRFPRAAHALSATKMALRTKLGLNEKASYTAEDRDRRAAAYAAEQAAQA
jgi:molybdopterin/thiamine biosynthesis adenylyltransferase